MIANNMKRLNIWMSLINKFDYDEFKGKCLDDGVDPLAPLEFAQKSGLISTALVMFPELPIAEAYLTFVRTQQSVFIPPQVQAVTDKQTQGCCGGGVVK